MIRITQNKSPVKQNINIHLNVSMKIMRPHEAWLSISREWGDHCLGRV